MYSVYSSDSGLASGRKCSLDGCREPVAVYRAVRRDGQTGASLEGEDADGSGAACTVLEGVFASVGTSDSEICRTRCLP